MRSLLAVYTRRHRSLSSSWQPAPCTLSMAMAFWNRIESLWPELFNFIEQEIAHIPPFLGSMEL